jgi:hypothetical protein
MNEKYITATYMLISGAGFAVAFALAETNYERAMAMGFICLLNVIIRLDTKNK